MNAPHSPWPAIATPPRHFIDNVFVPAQGGLTLPVVDPSDGAPFASTIRVPSTCRPTAVSAETGDTPAAMTKPTSSARSHVTAAHCNRLDHPRALRRTAAH